MPPANQRAPRQLKEQRRHRAPRRPRTRRRRNPAAARPWRWVWRPSRGRWRARRRLQAPLRRSRGWLSPASSSPRPFGTSPFLARGRRCRGCPRSRFPCPESRRCHFLRARSLPGLASPCPSAVPAGQGPGPWPTSRPGRSRPRLRGQRPPPPPPRPGEPCQGPARAGGDPRAAGETLREPPTPQLEPTHWNWQELEAGEVREGSFPTAQGPVPKGRGRRSRELLAILLEHSYSQGPLRLPQR